MRLNISVMMCAVVATLGASAAREAFAEPANSSPVLQPGIHYLPLVGAKPTGSLTLMRDAQGKLAPMPPRIETAVPDAAAVQKAVSAYSFYPGDVTSGGGPTMASARQHLIYLNCTVISASKCWGDPATFITDLSNSTFIHVADQYIGTTGNNRYPLGKQAFLTSTFDGMAYDSDIQAIVKGFVDANKMKGGLTNIYHVFLPQDQEICIDAANTTCYSPSNATTFVFCGYHSAFLDNYIGQYIVYTVEPYQGVDGCRASPTTLLTHATASVLSHEIFESITDPLVGSGYTVPGSVLGGNEIGDNCVWKYFPFLVGAHTYAIQIEYSNKVHRCVNTP
jgi:hypothetical protein